MDAKPLDWVASGVYFLQALDGAGSPVWMLESAGSFTFPATIQGKERFPGGNHRPQRLIDGCLEE